MSQPTSDRLKSFFPRGGEGGLAGREGKQQEKETGKTARLQRRADGLRMFRRSREEEGQARPGKGREGKAREGLDKGLGLPEI